MAGRDGRRRPGAEGVMSAAMGVAREIAKASMSSSPPGKRGSSPPGPEEAPGEAPAVPTGRAARRRQAAAVSRADLDRGRAAGGPRAALPPGQSPPALPAPAGPERSLPAAPEPPSAGAGGWEASSGSERSRSGSPPVAAGGWEASSGSERLRSGSPPGAAGGREASSGSERSQPGSPPAGAGGWEASSGSERLRSGSPPGAAGGREASSGRSLPESPPVAAGGREASSGSERLRSGSPPAVDGGRGTRDPEPGGVAAVQDAKVPAPDRERAPAARHAAPETEVAVPPAGHPARHAASEPAKARPAAARAAAARPAGARAAAARPAAARPAAARPAAEDRAAAARGARRRPPVRTAVAGFRPGRIRGAAQRVGGPYWGVRFTMSLIIAVMLLTVTGFAYQRLTGVQVLPDGPAARFWAAPRDFPVLRRSEPVRIRARSVQIDAPIHSVGNAQNGAIDVPTGDRFNEAGWYNKGPTPGEYGPAVIVGHVDNGTGPSVFHKLSRLRPGNRVEITRTDGTVAVFQVNTSKRYDRHDLPVDEVFGDFSRPGLRLITCGGRWVGGTTGYADNVVVFASLVKSRPGER
ncbi:hypothetical protein Psuf_075750 [Phytohabitans suffuscus]|uniref:Class F sortase n=1 Tax=Phytohabitans suffuscus TaxID=624315 RepID=A0A6F8YVY0_9ACTN|nr:hypothetical protein Psuf_075750 [Phytohabitans suffuscus]